MKTLNTAAMILLLAAPAAHAGDDALAAQIRQQGANALENLNTQIAQRAQEPVRTAFEVRHEDLTRLVSVKKPNRVVN